MISPVKLWRRQKEIKDKLGKKGRILTWTVIHVSSTGFVKQVPYCVVLVEFENGNQAVGQLVNYEKKDMKIGKRVIGILRKLKEVGKEDVIIYGLKFKPI